VSLEARALDTTERELLARSPFFSGLGAARLERVAALGRVLSFPGDTRIYTVGDAVDDFYVLTHGIVRFSLGLGKRDTSAGDIIRSGKVFGWAALMERYPLRIATAYCITSCEVVAIDGAQLRALMESDHSTGFFIMKQLAVLLTSELTAFAAG
jgi:toluene monooxygenase system ferredoxin subunit